MLIVLSALALICLRWVSHEWLEEKWSPRNLYERKVTESEFPKRMLNIFIGLYIRMHAILKLNSYNYLSFSWLIISTTERIFSLRSALLFRLHCATKEKVSCEKKRLVHSDSWGSIKQPYVRRRIFKINSLGWVFHPLSLWFLLVLSHFPICDHFNEHF